MTFVLVVSGISNETFEKAMEVKIAAGDAIRFVPQGNGTDPVKSSGMTSTKPTGTTADVINNVRFEWGEKGAEFGARIVRVLGGHSAEHREAAA